MLKALFAGVRRECFARQTTNVSWTFCRVSTFLDGRQGAQGVSKATFCHFSEVSKAFKPPLERWLLSIGLTAWDLQRIPPNVKQQIFRHSVPQLETQYKALLCEQRLGSKQELVDLVREYPRLLLPNQRPGSHLHSDERLKRKWYPHTMIEALELYAGGLSAALQALRAQPELQKLEPVLFAQHARKLKSLGVSPGQINLLAVKLPVLFEQQSFLKSTKTGMDILNYFCKVLGHCPVYLLLKKMPLLQACRLPEVQKRVAFMDIRGYQGYRKNLNWVRQSPRRFCQELNCSQDEFSAFKKDLALRSPGGRSGRTKQSRKTASLGTGKTQVKRANQRSTN